MKAYLAAKPKDIRFPQTSDLTDTPPFVTIPDEDATMTDAAEPSIDWSAKCPVFEAVGECSQGLKCRFLGGHARRGENGEIVLIVDEERKAREIVAHTEVNFVTGETLKAIRSKKVSRPSVIGGPLRSSFPVPSSHSRRIFEGASRDAGQRKHCENPEGADGTDSCGGREGRGREATSLVRGHS